MNMKRFHFSRKDTNEMRMQLTVLDWGCTTILLLVLHVSSQKVVVPQLQEFTSSTLPCLNLLLVLNATCSVNA